MAKHLLYLTNNQLVATVWDKDVFSTEKTFSNYASGWLAFSEYLELHRDIPAYLLTDLVEEDFQRENIPHVFGRARNSLIQRRLNTLYRDTPFHKASHQGRAHEGRKDDQMLFSALTNPILIKPWLEQLHAKKIDVAGIYSVALLSPLFFKKLHFGTEPTLLITHQSSGLRQSYFHEGYLRFSRLAPETAWSSESVAEFAKSEIAKTTQFLASTRLILRGDAINVVVIANSEIISYLHPLCPDVDGMRHRLIDLNEARHIFDLKKMVDITLCEPLFLSTLASQRIPSHYTTLEQAKFHNLSKTRGNLDLLSAVTVTGAVVWTFANGYNAFHASNQAQKAQLDTQQILAKHQATASSTKVTLASPQDMKTAVEVAGMITNNTPTPTSMLAQLGKALDTLPQIKIHQINWQVSSANDAQTDAAAVPVASTESTPLVAKLIGIPNRPIEILTLEGEVVPFKNDYRTALDSVNQLTRELQKNAHMQVEITKPPIDLRPTVKLDSQAGNDADLMKPRFNLKLVWKP
ncbi:hypothetical protein ACO0K9_16330 [Undibacterium sp. Ji50W]|uniref:hypothetical protein n=1 Tax=Undibacterium sp. Ji50W TaxID=3413041 RepID=UPI003BEFB29A